MSSEELAYICAGSTLVFYGAALVFFLVSVPRNLRRIADALEEFIKKKG